MTVSERTSPYLVGKFDLRRVDGSQFGNSTNLWIDFPQMDAVTVHFEVNGVPMTRPLVKCTAGPKGIEIVVAGE